MKYPEFNEKFTCEEVTFDRSASWPMGRGIYYRCLKCDDVLRSRPSENTQCSCGAMSWDVEYVRFGALNRSDVSVLRAKRKWLAIFR